MVLSLLKCHRERLFHNFSPVWFVCCTPSQRESWNYRSPSAELGKHLFSDRNGSRYWLKPMTKKGARWEIMRFYSTFMVHFIWQPCLTDTVFDYGPHCLRWFSSHIPVGFYFSLKELRSKFWGVSFSGHSPRSFNLQLAIKNQICHVSSAQSQDAHQNDSAVHLQIVPITHNFKQSAFASWLRYHRP